MSKQKKFIPNSVQRHLMDVIEQNSRRSGERLLYSKVMDNMSWDDFNYREVSDALDVLQKNNLITKDENFITRLW